jgi:hypothetical protein
MKDLEIPSVAVPSHWSGTSHPGYPGEASGDSRIAARRRGVGQGGFYSALS